MIRPYVVVALLVTSPHAADALPLPDYEQDLSIQVWHELNASLERGQRLRLEARALPEGPAQNSLNSRAQEQLEAVVSGASRFSAHIGPSSGHSHLVGLAHLELGRQDQAMKAFKHSIQLDPNNAFDAWFDLGQLHVRRGEWRDALVCFDQVREGMPDAWPASEAAALAAGQLADADAMETYLREAIARGMPTSSVLSQPEWEALREKPATREPIERLETIYGHK